MNEDNQSKIKEVMSIIGRSRSPRKLEALAENRAKLSSEETRAKMRQAQAVRRERERAALGIEATPAVKRPPGRPRKSEAGEAETKRPRGRPKKSEAAQITPPEG